MLKYSQKSSYHENVITKFGNPYLNKDQKQILQMVLYALEGLHSLGFDYYQSIVELFKKNGFKKKAIYINSIMHISQNIAKDTNNNLKWIKCGTLRKANNNEKNIIMNYLLFVYPEHFFKYLEDFLLKNKSNKGSVDELMARLKIKLNNNSNIQHSTNYNFNINKTNQEQEKQDPEIQGNGILDIDNNKTNENIAITFNPVNGDGLDNNSEAIQHSDQFNVYETNQMPENQDKFIFDIGNNIFNDDINYEYDDNSEDNSIFDIQSSCYSGH